MVGRGVASIMIVRRTEGCAREGDPSFCPLPRVASTRSCVCRTWRRGIFPLPAVVSHRYQEGQLFFLLQVGTCSFWQPPSIDNQKTIGPPSQDQIELRCFQGMVPSTVCVGTCWQMTTRNNINKVNINAAQKGQTHDELPPSSQAIGKTVFGAKEDHPGS